MARDHVVEELDRDLRAGLVVAEGEMHRLAVHAAGVVDDPLGELHHLALRAAEERAGSGLGYDRVEDEPIVRRRGCGERGQHRHRGARGAAENLGLHACPHHRSSGIPASLLTGCQSFAAASQRTTMALLTSRPRCGTLTKS